jgi:hypothetical protein
MYQRLPAMGAALILSALLFSCSQDTTSPLQASPDNPSAASPDAQQLSELLDQEFARLGIDPSRIAADAPGGNDNSVFNLSGEVIDPDGVGGDPPTGIDLNWIEQMVGDYDMNGAVGISDLTAIGQFYLDPVSYDDPGLHGGFGDWPSGNPLDASTGALNWRLARVDGNADGSVSIQDLTPLALHFKQRLHGYRVYRKLPGETSFSLLPDPGDSGSPMSVDRPAVFDKVVAYNFSDDLSSLAISTGVVEYYVAPYDELGSLEGTESWHISLDLENDIANQAPNAALEADDLDVATLATVNLDASGSSDDDAVVFYEWDLDGNGSFEANTGTISTNSTSFAAAGSYVVSVRVSDAESVQDTASVTINVIDGTEDVFDIGGTILDGDSLPAVGVTVYLADGINPTMDVTTDINGDYIFADLQVRDYVVTPLLSGYVMVPIGAEVELIDQDITDVDFVAEAANDVLTTIRVIQCDRPPAPPADPGDWHPLEGIALEAYISDGITLVGTEYTDANGYADFNLPALASGTIYVIRPAVVAPSGDHWFMDEITPWLTSGQWLGSFKDVNFKF